MIGDMAEDGFRRDVPRLLEAADAGRIQLEVRLLPTNQAVNPASGFLNSIAGLGVAKPPSALANFVRMATWMARKSCFVSCWWRHSR